MSLSKKLRATYQWIADNIRMTYATPDLAIQRLKAMRSRSLGKPSKRDIEIDKIFDDAIQQCEQQAKMLPALRKESGAPNKKVPRKR